MRKTLIFTVLLALLAVGSVGYVAASIYPLRDQVTVWEADGGRDSYGDASAAEGLVATFQADYYEAMNWSTRVYFGDEQLRTTTDYVLDFPVQKTTNYLRDRNEINIRVTIENVVDPSAFAYLAEGLAPGEKRQETIYLKDYADFFNTEVEILFPEETYAWRPSDTTVDNETEAALKALFDENLLFPIGERVSVEGHGDIGEYGPSYGYGVNASSETFGLEVKAVFCGERAYFVFERSGESYSDLDVSHLPLGYGVYCVAVPRDGGQPTLQNVYALDHGAAPLKLAVDEAGNLLVYTVEEGRLCVAVLDTKTNAVTQSLELTDFPTGTTTWATYEADGAAAVTLWQETGNCRLVLLTVGTDGLYRLHWNLEIPSEKSHLLSYSDVTQKRYRYDFTPVMAWNGQYLAFGISEEYRSGFDIALYGENGQVYHNSYLTSLNLWPIAPDGDLPLTLEWEQALGTANRG